MIRAAFHHFEEKKAALNEIARVLKPRGILRIYGGQPEYRREWWVYRYFPETVEMDTKRFWSVDKYFEEVSAAGFEVEIIAMHHRRLADKDAVVERAMKRDLSQLAVLENSVFQKGLERLRADKKAKIVSSQGTIDVRAIRRG